MKQLSCRLSLFFYGSAAQAVRPLQYNMETGLPIWGSSNFTIYRKNKCLLMNVRSIESWLHNRMFLFSIRQHSGPFLESIGPDKFRSRANVRPPTSSLHRKSSPVLKYRQHRVAPVWWKLENWKCRHRWMEKSAICRPPVANCTSRVL